MPLTGEYEPSQNRAGREIPVLVLEPLRSPSESSAP
jgi:hypothetical protein